MKIHSHSTMKNLIISVKNAGIFFTLLLLAFNQSKACSPLNVPTLVTWSVTATNLNLNWSSNTTYNCTYSVQVELSCLSKPFTGIAPFFISPGINKTSTPYAFPLQSINITTLCPGTVYQFRAREVYGAATFSGWTSTYTFTTPGVFVMPTGTITATPPIILACPQGSSQLAFNCSNCCGSIPYNYTWTPAASLSCSTCASPIATPSVTTIYTLNMNGGKLGCWGITNTVLVTVINTPPVVGIAAVTPGTMCANNTATLSITTFSGSIQWQSGPTAAGPWTNLPGGTTGTFVTAPLTTTTFSPNKDRFAQ